jgi:hypothetical protein
MKSPRLNVKLHKKSGINCYGFDINGKFLPEVEELDKIWLKQHKFIRVI